VPEYPEASIREIAICLMAADDLLTDFARVEDAVAFARRIADGVDSDPLWADGRHDGDCTSQPHTCSRCVLEGYEDKARSLILQEGFTPPAPASGTQIPT
jgi:hypothetical protein